MELQQFLEKTKDYKIKAYGEVLHNKALYLVVAPTYVLKKEADNEMLLYSFQPPKLSSSTIAWDEDHLPYLEEVYLESTLRLYLTPNHRHHLLQAMTSLPTLYKGPLGHLFELINRFIEVREAFVREHSPSLLEKNLIEQYFGAADLWLMGQTDTVPNELLNEIALIMFLSRVDRDKLEKKAIIENGKRSEFFTTLLRQKQKEVRELLARYSFTEALLDGISFETRYQEDVRKNKHIEGN